MDVVSWHVAKPDHFFFDTKKQRKKHSSPPVHLKHPKPNAVVGMAGFTRRYILDILWWINIAIENGHWNSGFSHSTWWFSIAMLVHQRISWGERMDVTCWWALGSRLAKRRSNIWEGTWKGQGVTSPLPKQVAHAFPTISTVFNQMITIL